MDTAARSGREKILRGTDEDAARIRSLFADDVRRLRCHPEFRELVLDYCLRMSEAHIRLPARRVLSRQFTYVACFNLIVNHLRWKHFGGGPPVLAAIKALDPSRSRHIADLIGCLVQMDLVKTVRDSSDRRIMILEPAPELVTEITRHPSLACQIYERLAMDSAGPEFTFDPSRALLVMLRATETPVQTDLSVSPFPSINAISSHDCGYLLLVTVFRRHYATGMRATNDAAPLSLLALASHLHVSQSHAANMLREARRSDWFRIERGGNAVRISPALVDEFEHFIANQAAYFGRLADSLGGPHPFSN